MVLGPQMKNRRSPSVQVDYLIHIQEIKPWPPSQSLRTLRAVLIQWEHGDRNSGSTNQVIPSLGTGSGVGDGRIEFNESFRLPVVLLRELSAKGGDRDTFQKNCIEFNLYEPRRDKTVKGQLLGTAVVDFADYGIVDESLCISTAINCKRTYRNTAQPLLFLKIQSVERSRTNSSSKDRLLREPSMERNGVDSVSGLMNEEYAEEAETASYSDDDISSHSSLAVSSSVADSNGGSPPQEKENRSEGMKTRSCSAEVEHVPAPKDEFTKADENQLIEPNASSKGNSSRLSSIDISSDLAWITKKIGACSVQSSSLSTKHEEREALQGGHSSTLTSTQQSTEACTPSGSLRKDTLSDPDVRASKKSDLLISMDSHALGGLDDITKTPSTKGVYGAARADLTQYGDRDCEKGEKHEENGDHREVMEDKGQSIEDEPLYSFSQDETRKPISIASDALSPSTDYLATKDAPQNTDRFRHLKSVRSPIDSNRSTVRGNQYLFGGLQNGSQDPISNERKDNSAHPKETRNTHSDNKIQQLEQRVKILERELTAAAAIEVGLYSVVAEHGSSKNKVHAPARRLSRFYLHACRVNSQSGAGSPAKSAVSGLILVAKACGHDIPRLTFWLSNTIVLRAIISESFGELQLPLSAGPAAPKNTNRNRNKKSSPIKWQSLPTKGMKTAAYESSHEWEDPHALKTALEKVEGWIFYRIVESIWWQILTPHMQSGAAKTINKDVFSDPSKEYRRTSSSRDQEQSAFPVELWKNAFRGACERICPVRAEGHECGCLPILSRLIMEQCVARLDAAMFNAILRESADDIPTDPVSDPISDAEVLPIPPGKASFGAGAQLKNAIGNWSRWLTDLFGIDDDDDSCKDTKGSDGSSDDERQGKDTSKSFHLLNALSDLMMLPKDMLLSRTIRKEVCPTFGPALIRRVLDAFVPDEFCPDQIPKVVLEALNAEDSFEEEEDSLVNFPCAAASIVYLPPSAASIAGFLGDANNRSQLTRRGSLVLTKSYTSDDEIDELDSPWNSVITGSTSGSPSIKPHWISKGSSNQNAIRYQLLREVWKNSD